MLTEQWRSRLIGSCLKLLSYEYHIMFPSVVCDRFMALLSNILSFVLQQGHPACTAACCSSLRRFLYADFWGSGLTCGEDRKIDNLNKSWECVILQYHWVTCTAIILVTVPLCHTCEPGLQHLHVWKTMSCCRRGDTCLRRIQKMKMKMKIDAVTFVFM